MNKQQYDQMLIDVQRKLADEGKLIEAGFAGLRLACIPRDASQIQIQEMRKAFMAGAQHLFASMNAIMTDDREPTEADLRRLTQIHVELEAFAAELVVAEAYPQTGGRQ